MLYLLSVRKERVLPVFYFVSGKIKEKEEIGERVDINTKISLKSRKTCLADYFKKYQKRVNTRFYI